MFSKKNLSTISIEETTHAEGSRKMIVGKNETTSKYFEAHTYGYLPAGALWKMHAHENIVEICVVTKGAGVVRDAEGNEEIFVAGDRFIFPANTLHEIKNTSSEVAEFYFFRLQDQ